MSVLLMSWESGYTLILRDLIEEARSRAATIATHYPSEVVIAPVADKARSRHVCVGVESAYGRQQTITIKAP